MRAWLSILRRTEESVKGDDRKNPSKGKSVIKSESEQNTQQIRRSSYKEAVMPVYKEGRQGVPESRIATVFNVISKL